MRTAGRNSRHSPASERIPKMAPIRPASRKKSNQPTRRKRSRNAVAWPQASFGCMFVRGSRFAALQFAVYVGHEGVVDAGCEARTATGELEHKHRRAGGKHRH